MKDQQFEEFCDLMSAIAELYGKEQSEFSLAIWWEALKAYDLRAVRDALNRHVMNPDTGQFMPKPADVVRMFGGTTQDSALMAWAKVDKAVKGVGPYKDIAFDDGLIHRVIDDMGGWILLCGKKESEWPFVAKEFENRYRGYAMKGEMPEYRPVLVGMANAHNMREGFEVTPQVLIGCPVSAQNVMALGNDKAGSIITRVGYGRTDKKLLGVS